LIEKGAFRPPFYLYEPVPPQSISDTAGYIRIHSVLPPKYPARASSLIYLLKNIPMAATPVTGRNVKTPQLRPCFQAAKGDGVLVGGMGEGEAGTRGELPCAGMRLIICRLPA